MKLFKMCAGSLAVCAIFALSSPVLKKQTFAMEENSEIVFEDTQNAWQEPAPGSEDKRPPKPFRPKRPPFNREQHNENRPQKNDN